MGDFFLRYCKTSPPITQRRRPFRRDAGCNYSNRSSAPEVEDEGIKEQAQIVADVRVLKNSAVDYAHPEVGVTTSDWTQLLQSLFMVATPVVTIPIAPLLLKLKTKILRSKLR